MADQLTTTTNSGQQSATQSPQTAGQPALSGASTGSIQPGTSNDLLSGQGSIPLSNQPVTTVSLTPASTQTAANPPPQSVPAGHHLNPWLITLALLLLLLAGGWAAVIKRSAKNTT